MPCRCDEGELKATQSSSAATLLVRGDGSTMHIGDVPAAQAPAPGIVVPSALPRMASARIVAATVVPSMASASIGASTEFLEMASAGTNMAPARIVAPTVVPGMVTSTEPLDWVRSVPVGQ